MKKQSIIFIIFSIVLSAFIMTGCSNDTANINITKTAKIYTFDNSTLILTEAGTLYAVGDNSKGLLGIGNNVNSNGPVLVNVPRNVKDVIVHKIEDVNKIVNYSIYVIMQSGVVYAWGYNQNGRLGIDSLEYNINTPSPVNINGLVSDIIINNNSIYAILNDGSLFAWGDNTDGRLGVGDKYSRSKPTKVLLPGSVSKLILNDTSSYAILTDGSLYVWGQNAFGQLGTGDFTSMTSPVKSLVQGVISRLMVNGISVYALTSDGSLYTWGYNYSGQLGIASIEQLIPTPTKVALNGAIKDYILDDVSSYAILTDGSLYTWGENTFGQLGNGDFINQNAPVKVNITGVKELKIYAKSVYAVTSDGSLYTWGYNTYGQLGIGDFENKSTPSKVALPAGFKNFLKLDYAVLAELSDNSIYVWGMNNYGQLGIGDYENKSLPVKLTLPGKIKKIIHTTGTIFIILEDNLLYAWGENVTGQLGVGDFESKNIPVKVMINGEVSDIYINNNEDNYSIYALMLDGSLYSWGANEKGELGVSTAYTYFPYPSKVNVTGEIKSIFINILNTIYLLMEDGSMYGWGDNTYGKLGVNSKELYISYPLVVNIK